MLQPYFCILYLSFSVLSICLFDIIIHHQTSKQSRPAANGIRSVVGRWRCFPTPVNAFFLLASDCFADRNDADRQTCDIRHKDAASSVFCRQRNRRGGAGGRTAYFFEKKCRRLLTNGGIRSILLSSRPEPGAAADGEFRRGTEGGSPGGFGTGAVRNGNGRNCCGKNRFVRNGKCA